MCGAVRAPELYALAALCSPGISGARGASEICPMSHVMFMLCLCMLSCLKQRFAGVFWRVLSGHGGMADDASMRGHLATVRATNSVDIVR